MKFRAGFLKIYLHYTPILFIYLFFLTEKKKISTYLFIIYEPKICIFINGFDISDLVVFKKRIFSVSFTF